MGWHKPLPLLVQELATAPPCIAITLFNMIILDPVKVLKYGLEEAGHGKWPHTSLDKATKLHMNRFRQSYGVGPNAIVEVAKDLQSEDLLGNDLAIKNLTLKDLLMSLSWLKTYPKEHNHAGKWKVCENVARKKTWRYLKSFQGLKDHKVKWIIPDPNHPPDEIFICSVDGVQCHRNLRNQLLFGNLPSGRHGS
jgi:hypothetical protein